MSDSRLTDELSNELEGGFNIKTVVNGFIVTPWGWDEPNSPDFQHVFNTKEQLCEFISNHCHRFEIPKSFGN